MRSPASYWFETLRLSAWFWTCPTSSTPTMQLSDSRTHQYKCTAAALQLQYTMCVPGVRKILTCRTLLRWPRLWRCSSLCSPFQGRRFRASFSGTPMPYPNAPAPHSINKTNQYATVLISTVGAAQLSKGTRTLHIVLSPSVSKQYAMQ